MKTVDLFAGWGGFSLGAEMAGCEIKAAANHWPLAVQAHAANHPDARHICQDLRQFDFADLPNFDLLLAAPACQGHSTAAQPARAKGGKVRSSHDALRSTAFAVIDCLDVCEPSAFIVENVPAFTKWRLFKLWLAMTAEMGYRVELHHLLAADHGVPQLRHRLFITGVKSGRGVSIPRPTEDRPPAFGPCVEWGSGKWRPFSTLRPAARARVEECIQKAGPRFVGQHVSHNPAWSVDEPVRTVTTQDQIYVVDGRDRYRLLSVRETARAMGFPDGHRTPDGATRGAVIRGYGNAVCPPQGRDVVRGVMEAA